MRDINRIDPFCEELARLWKRVPDWRFGQLMSNFLGDVYVEEKGVDIFFIEDDKMLEHVRRYAKMNEENDE